MDKPQAPAQLLGRGIEHFNGSEFFEAHEVWEDIWRLAREPEKTFLQGLIQTAVALHHHSTGNVTGARSLLRRAALKLDKFPSAFCEIDLAELRAQMAAWQDALDHHAPVPAFPKLRRLGRSDGSSSGSSV
jgi:hypothetical protein